jgi:hypothetical protein
MTNRICVLAAALAVATGCANQLDSGGASGPETHQVGKVSAALFTNCSEDDARFLGNHAFYVATAATEAYGNYAPDSPLVLKYFGTGHDNDSVKSTLEQIINVAYSDQLNFVCDPSEAGDGTDCDNPATVLWSWDSAWRTGDWTIHVCGHQLWAPKYENGVDNGAGASQTGIMVHEIAHLAGAWWEGYGEDFVLQSAQQTPYFSPLYAEAYRLYVMNQDR